MAASGPVLVVDVDGGELEHCIAKFGREHDPSPIATGGCPEEHSPSVAGVVFLNGHRLERIELGVEHVLKGPRPGTGSEPQIQRR